MIIASLFFLSFLWVARKLVIAVSLSLPKMLSFFFHTQKLAMILLLALLLTSRKPYGRFPGEKYYHFMNSTVCPIRKSLLSLST